MGASTGASPGAGKALLALYDDALPYVYGYLVSRCGQRGLAEDLTSETFLAAVEATRTRASPPADTLAAPLTQAWLIGVARHKLADHWRRQQRQREHQRTHAVALALAEQLSDDPWDAQLDRLLARQTLQGLTPAHQAALTLRYVDDLPVRECAAILDRTVHATEALLVRARRAFRAAYPATGEEAHRA